MERPDIRSSKNMCCLWIYMKKLLQGRRWEISVIASWGVCHTVQCPHLYLLNLIHSELACFLVRILRRKLRIHTENQEWVMRTNIRWFCNTIVLQWSWCGEKWDCSFHGLRYHAWWPWTNKQVSTAARPYQSEEKQGAFCWEVRQTRQVFRLKTQQPKVREHRSLSHFFVLNSGLDLQAKNRCNCKGVTPN